MLAALGSVPSRPIDGGTSLRQSEEMAARLQHRRDEDLPPVPATLEPGSGLHHERERPLEVAPSPLTPPVAPDVLPEPLAKVEERLAERLASETGKLSPTVDASAPAWMREFHVDRPGVVD